MQPKKNEKVDLTKNSSLYFVIGLATILFISWQAIEWKTYEKDLYGYEALNVDDEDDEEIPITEQLKTPPPPPPPPPPVEDEIFKVVEQMPRFPGCEDISGGEAEKKKCAEEKMLQYIYKSLKYPAIARENGIEGRAILQFVVDKDGSVTEVNVVRDPGAGTGDAAKKVINAMNDMPTKWTPGKQRGRPVKVLYTLPVLFRLEG